ncbi:PA2169 family four-helix-bundle protein [Flavobacterium ponti]|uniref:PA2169 family four-helix-bundle protein n=1 Tax=Flavobacterium ponti TaxID=665133 RepID=A0ABV9P7P8_9FLAO
MKATENVKILNGLISILDDGKVGYTNAAENCEDESLKTEFLSIARERALMIVQLQDEVKDLGQSTDATDGPLGAVHRVWIDFKSLITGHDNDAIIEACMTGEQYAIATYKKALDNKSFSASTETVVVSQLAMIERALAKIKSLKTIDA